MFSREVLYCLLIAFSVGVFVGIIIGMKMGYDQGISETVTMYENLKDPIDMSDSKKQADRFLTNKRLLDRVQ